MALSSLLRPIGRVLLAGVRDDLGRVIEGTVRDTVDNVFGTKPGESPSEPTVPMGTWEDISAESMVIEGGDMQIVVQRMQTAHAILFRCGKRDARTGRWRTVPRIAAIRRELTNGPAF